MHIALWAPCACRSRLRPHTRPDGDFRRRGARRYGFLSENVEFATAVQDAGIQFLGPDPATFKMFSLKHTARAVAEAAQVPLVRLGSQRDSELPLLASHTLNCLYALSGRSLQSFAGPLKALFGRDEIRPQSDVVLPHSRLLESDVMATFLAGAGAGAARVESAHQRGGGRQPG